MQFDITVPNNSEAVYFRNYFRKQLKFKNSFQNSGKSCKISIFNLYFSRFSDFV